MTAAELPPDLPPDLLGAYRRAIYRALLPEGAIDLRVGETSAALDRALAARGATRWAWLTAVNPRSRRLTDAENARRLAALDAELARHGWQAFPGLALDPTNDWPAESSRLVLEADPAAIAALARRFDQHAWLTGAVDGPATLHGVA